MKTTSQATPPQRVLVIDVGGSHVKFKIGPRGATPRFDSGPNLTARQMVAGVTASVQQDAYDAVSIGYPGVVIQGRIVAEPHNLGRGWVHFDFAKALGKPARIINDAAMQAIGSYAGGRMLFLGLGTGLGIALIVEGYVEPMELGHMLYKKGRTFEDYVGERGRARMGTKKWRQVVSDIVEQLSRALEVEYVVIGGGNARRLKQLPANAHLGDNGNAFIGGVRLWQCSDRPLWIDPKRCSRVRLDQRVAGGRRAR